MCAHTHAVTICRLIITYVTTMKRNHFPKGPKVLPLVSGDELSVSTHVESTVQEEHWQMRGHIAPQLGQGNSAHPICLPV